jgi:hypothetical protein
MSEGVVNAFLFACVICPIFSSSVILERQSRGELQTIPDGVGDGLDGVAVGGRPAASELVVIDITSIVMTIIGIAILRPARSAFLEENIRESFRGSVE